MALDPSALSLLKLGRTATEAPRPRRRRGWWIGALVLLLVAGLLARPRVLEVETIQASAPDVGGRTTVLNASGYVVARRIATIASKVTGRIVSVHVEEGQHVTAGEVLARLDRSTAQAAWVTAQRVQDAAQRALVEIEVRLADAERAWQRAHDLATRHLVAQSVLDTAQADRDALRARLAVTQAEAATATATVAQRRQDVEDLTIRAPFTGVAVSKDAQPGEMVSPISAGGGFPRTGIATIVDMDSLELEVDVNEAYINRVHEGQLAEAILDAYPGAPLAAHVINIVPTADRQKATIKVRIGVDHLQPHLLPDMGVKVRFLEEAPPGQAAVVALLPSTAVLVDGSQHVVWIVDAGHLHRTPVVLAPSPGDEAAILSGLAPGAVVVARPDASLKDGVRARVKSGG